MTEKQLKRLTRRELLEMLILQTRKVEQLQKQLEEANARLNDKMIILENAGSMAEAVMRLNGVFEAAEKAAEQYLENIRGRAISAQQTEGEMEHAQAQ